MIGSVASIRVCRDAVTRRSLGYAYVNFMNAADGERALEQLNYTPIKGKPCRIMWSQRDPALRKTSLGNIFIKNLDESIDNKALHDTFAAFGNILSCKVALDENGLSKGYGFVHYEGGEAAEAAIQAVNGMLLNDKVVYVGHHVPRRERQAKIDEVRSNYTNLYVKGLAPEISEAEFSELFAKYGQVTSAVLQVDQDGKSKGFGFVNFADHEAAAKALTELHDSEHKGQTLYVSRAQKKGEREEELKKSYEQQKYDKSLKYQGVNLYVKNLEDDMDEEKVTAEFAAFGTITSTKIMRDEKGASKGFGFVCFSSPDEATKAVTELNGKMFGQKPLYVSLAQRKDVRKQQLEAQLAQRNQIRSQQLAASGIPPNMPPYGMPPNQMYYPGPGGYPQQRGMMYPPQGMPGMPPRPRYAPAGAMPGMPMGYPPQGYPGPYGPGRPGPQSRYSMPPNGMPNGMPPQQMGMRGPPGQMGPNGGMPPRPGQPLMQGQPPRAGPPAAAGARAGFKAQPAQRGAPENAAQQTAAALANASPAEQKQIIGEMLYPLILETRPEQAGKITGMLLEMDAGELLMLIDSREALDVKIAEALAVLEQYQAQQEGGEQGAAPTEEPAAVAA
ncbi:uncharacterized protein L969DRAFT_43189 [Mixia osmundae IAM 14324]|uniref:Polyadenylate-binding protein n=1 Tax=Mixia osmundae (strain CBS 9802 / IAM 14324 / JCM 22182 / KY 12970) TaxID=764103 RepID=G7DZ99_MIXOS|nr:uncharacterized protein L969DRAFT_43189 [Mixia osmundae IAM 14324]KEI42625.1 hypothetical protein L969DRAFT_43189 [Mixia osmundae IAM 14324]GAA95909.1 hypothetical protein E5Q_02567 [Mixia osmundae IAM 14324]